MPATGDPTLYYVIGAIVVIAIVVVALVVARRSRSAAIARRFGPEYGRTVREKGGRAEAERELAAREARVKKMNIQDLPRGAKERYVEEWRSVQSEFVDAPKAALGKADALVTNVMRDRGYPMGDFDQVVADLSPDHPAVVDNYRGGHAIAARSERGEVSTEDLRKAMVHYRAIFDDLVGVEERHIS